MYCTRTIPLALVLFMLGCGGSNSNSGKTTDNVGGIQGTTGGTSGTSTTGGSSGTGTTGGSSGNSTGGSSGTGTTGGTGGGSTCDPSAGGPPEAMSTGVAPCSGLSASTGWERITPPGDLGDSQAVQVDPNNPGKLYVQMHKGGNGAHFETDGLFVSEDCGATWIRVPQGRNACDPGVNINYGSISSMIIDPTNSDVMYIVSNYGYGGVFKSENAGIDWDQTVTGEAAEYVEKMWFNTLAMDPTDNEHLVAANHEGCNGPWAPNCLTETTDGGRTWSLFPAPVGWSEGNGVHIKDANTILFATYLDGVYLTRNRGADWARVDDGMAGVGTGPMAYRGSDGRYYVASFWGVKASTDWDSWENVYQGQFVNLTGTGNNMVTSAVYSFDYFIAAENSPTSWSPIMAQGGSDGDMGGIYMVSDPENHVIYSSNFGEGLWRLVVD